MGILIEIFKEELFAHESVQAIDGNKNRSSDETDYFTGHNLLNNSRKLLRREKSYINSVQYNNSHRNQVEYFEESWQVFFYVCQRVILKSTVNLNIVA